MISANEARKKVEAKNKKEIADKLGFVIGLIVDAIDSGKHSVYIEGHLRNEIIDILKQYGYKIEVGGRYNEIDTVISW